MASEVRALLELAGSSESSGRSMHPLGAACGLNRSWIKGSGSFGHKIDTGDLVRCDIATSLGIDSLGEISYSVLVHGNRAQGLQIDVVRLRSLADRRAASINPPDKAGSGFAVVDQLDDDPNAILAPSLVGVIKGIAGLPAPQTGGE